MEGPAHEEQADGKPTVTSSAGLHTIKTPKVTLANTPSMQTPAFIGGYPHTLHSTPSLGNRVESPVTGMESSVCWAPTMGRALRRSVPGFKDLVR